MPHDRSISEAKGADGLKCQPVSGLGTHWSKTLLWYRGSNVALGWLVHEHCEFEPICQKQRKTTAGQAPFWKQATGHHGEGWLLQVWVSQAPRCLFFSLLPSGHFIIFQGLPQKQKKNNHCMLPQFCRKVWLRDQAEASGFLLSYCAINYLKNMWLQSHNLLLSLTCLWVD